jgi:hypothetical protein
VKEYEEGDEEEVGCAELSGGDLDSPVWSSSY